MELLRPSKVKVERYRNRGTHILLPWMEPTELGAVGGMHLPTTFPSDQTPADEPRTGQAVLAVRIQSAQGSVRFTKHCVQV